MMTIDEIIRNASNLPPSPQILPKLLTVLQSSDSTYGEIAKLINLDQSLTSQVLTWSNSGYYGYVQKSVDMEEAISRVGVNEIYKLIGIVMVKRLADYEVSFYGLDPGELWENSLAAAFSMEVLAQRVAANVNVAYTVGLLHAMGKFVIGQACGNAYEDIFRAVEEEKLSLIHAEEKVIGHNHAQVGCALLEKWNFPKSVTHPIEYQYKPFAAKDYKNLAYMINFAHFVMASIGETRGHHSLAFEVDEKVFEQLSISPEDVQRTILEVHEKVEEIKRELLQVAV